MIVEICYDSDQGWLATGEPLADTKGSSEDLEELSFEQSDHGSITFSRCGRMYVIHTVRELGGDYTVIVYVADNKLEATRAFVEELESRLEEFGEDMTRRELEQTLKVLEKYKDYSKKFSTIKNIAEKLIAEKPPPPSLPSSPPPVSMTFETCKEQLKKDLSLSEDVINRTRVLIEEYQPHLDKTVKTLIDNYKTLIEEGETEYITPLFKLPEYLKPEMVIGACLYLACKERGVSVSQFQIAKAQGHYDTSNLSKAIRDLRVKLKMKNS